MRELPDTLKIQPTHKYYLYGYQILEIHALILEIESYKIQIDEYKKVYTDLIKVDQNNQVIIMTLTSENATLLEENIKLQSTLDKLKGRTILKIGIGVVIGFGVYAILPKKN